ncbi:MAG: prolipoprotein diacylglyceryl transferase [Methylococcaceae bacterium]|nr:MAG: prolipoprotein diacylglyceryl transferase [Methylococcaceae bacterium]
MINHPSIDPVAFSIGPVHIHWYGLMYVLGISGAWLMARNRVKTQHPEWSTEIVDDIIFYAALGVVLGGRIGYMLFYNFSVLLEDPFALFKVWQGGMSYHGGMLGVFVALWLLGRSARISFFSLTDFIAPMVPIGLFAGRIGNFINGELWGRPTDLPWGMVFTGAGPEPRHPSQLYEAALEGVLLFAVLLLFTRRPQPLMAVSGLYLLGYGLSRFTIEWVREPDRHMGFLAFDWLTMGQLLTLPMVLLGLGVMVYAYRRQE